MADRLGENGAIQFAQESTAAVGTVSRLGGAGQIEADIRRLVAEGFYTTKVAAYTVRGRLINAALDAISIFSPSSLFASGEVGAWYDPSDMSTLYQDSAGTTPVTAVEQPVGLMLDKSQGLEIGPELITNGTFDADSDWTKGTGWSIGSGVATKISGTATALAQLVSLSEGILYKITFTVTMTAGVVTPRFVGGTTSFANNITASGTYTIYLPALTGNNSFEFVSGLAFVGTIDNVSLKSIAGNHALQETSAARPTLSARYNLLLATATLATQNVTVTAGSHTLYFTGAGSITLSGATTGSYNAGTHTITTTAGTLTLTVSGSVLTADLRVVNGSVGLPVYQSVNTATDYDTVGFPVYLQYDGIDDNLLSLVNSIALTPDYTLLLGFYYNSGGTNSSYVSIAGITTSNNFFEGRIRTSISAIAVNTRGSNLAINLVSVNGGTNSCLPNTNHVITATFTDGLQTIQSDNDAITSGVNTWTESDTIPNRWFSGSATFPPKRHFEVILINRELTVSEINNTKSYLNNKMSVTA